MLVYIPRTIAIIVWAVLGLIMWIPLLVRCIAAESALNLLSVFSDIDTSRAEAASRKAYVFYIRGFARIWSGPKEDAGDGNDAAYQLGRSIAEFLKEMFWAILFWGLVIAPFFLMNQINFWDNLKFIYDKNAVKSNIRTFANSTVEFRYINRGIFSNSAGRVVHIKLISLEEQENIILPNRLIIKFVYAMLETRNQI